MSCADCRPRTAVVRAPGALAWLIGAAVLNAGDALAADLGDIVVIPTAGQTADEARRDRYECHNWAIGQNVTVPVADTANPGAEADRRAERVEKVVTGAAIGAAIGGMIRGARDHRDVGDGMLAGGVLGAIGGAAAGAKANKDDQQQAEGVFDEYFRALDACMTARGYALSVAGQDE